MVEQPTSFRSEPASPQEDVCKKSNSKNDCSSATNNGSDLSNVPVISISSPSVSSTVHETVEQEFHTSVSQALVETIKKEGGCDVLSPGTSSTVTNSSSRLTPGDAYMRSIHGAKSRDPTPMFIRNREPLLQRSPQQQVYSSDILSPGTSSTGTVSSSRLTPGDVYMRSIHGARSRDPTPTFNQNREPLLQRSPQQQVYSSDVLSPSTSSTDINSSSRLTPGDVYMRSILGARPRDPTPTFNQSREPALQRSPQQQVYSSDILSPGTSSTGTNSSSRLTPGDVYMRSIHGARIRDPTTTSNQNREPLLQRSPQQQVYSSDVLSPSTSSTDINSSSRLTPGDVYMRSILGARPRDPTPTFNQSREPGLQRSPKQQVYSSDILSPGTSSTGTNSSSRLTPGDVYMRSIHGARTRDPTTTSNQNREPALQRSPQQQVYSSDILSPGTSSTGTNSSSRLTPRDAYMRSILGARSRDPTPTFNQSREPALQRSPQQQVYSSDILSPGTSSTGTNSSSRLTPGDAYMRSILGVRSRDPTPTFNQSREPALQRSPQQQVYSSDILSPGTSSTGTNSSSRLTPGDVYMRSIHGARSRDPTPTFNQNREPLLQRSPQQKVYWDLPRLRHEMEPREFLSSAPIPQYWSTITYFELDAQVGDPFKVSSAVRSVIIDGYMDPLRMNRFCLGAISNVNRTEETQLARLFIGRGVQLDLMGEGDVWLRCLAEKSVFVRSHYLDHVAGIHGGGAVHKIYPSAYVKVFDLMHYHTKMKNQIEAAPAAEETEASVIVGYTRGPKGEGEITSGISLSSAPCIRVDDLRKPCMLRISLVKGWGPDYPRRCIKQTPCWVEIHLHRALQLLDELIHSQPSNRRRRIE